MISSAVQGTTWRKYSPGLRARTMSSGPEKSATPLQVAMHSGEAFQGIPPEIQDMFAEEGKNAVDKIACARGLAGPFRRHYIAL